MLRPKLHGGLKLQSLPKLLRTPHISEIKWLDIHSDSTHTERAVEVIESPLFPSHPQENNVGFCRKDVATLENEQILIETPDLYHSSTTLYGEGGARHGKM